MQVINNEFTNIDPVNKIVEMTFSVDDVVYAKIIFNFENDETEIKGDLCKLIGYKDNPIDKDKYIKYIQLQKWMAEKVLEKYNKAN